MRGLPEVRGRTREREVVRALAVWKRAADAGRGARWSWGASWRSDATVVAGLSPGLGAGR